MINEQLKKMKDSIHNIQNKLKDIDKTNQDTKILPTEQIIPFTIENNLCQVSQNIKSQNTFRNGHQAKIQYSPPRHHLDDSQMKKALKRCQKCDSFRQSSKAKLENSQKSKLKGQVKKYLVLDPRKLQEQKYLKFSQITPDKYENIFRPDGENKNKNRKYKVVQKNYQARNQYDIMPFEHIGQKHRDLSKRKSLKKKILSKQVKNTGKSKRTSKYKLQKIYDSQKRFTKNIRTQCIIQTSKIKQPFINNWNPDTTDQFSDFEL